MGKLTEQESNGDLTPLHLRVSRNRYGVPRFVLAPQALTTSAVENAMAGQARKA